MQTTVDGWPVTFQFLATTPGHALVEDEHGIYTVATWTLGT